MTREIIKIQLTPSDYYKKPTNQFAGKQNNAKMFETKTGLFVIIM